MSYLVITSGQKQGSRIPLEKKSLTIGREPAADIKIKDKNISRVHARFIRLDKNLTALVDLGSSNGTLVNDLPINRIFLMDGDEIKIGETILEYHEGDMDKQGLQEEKRSIRIEKKTVLSAHPLGQPTELFIRESEEEQSAILKKTYLQLRTLYKMISDIAQIRQTPAIFQRVAQVILHSLGIDRIVFFGCFEDREGFHSEGSFINPSLQSKSFDEKHPIHKQVLYCIQKEQLSYLFTEEGMDDDTGNDSNKPTIMGVPILYDKKLLGLIYLDNPKTHTAFEKSNLDLVSAIACHLGVIIHQLRNYRKLEKKNISLERVINDNLVIVCRNAKMLEIMDILNHLAETDSNVLIHGESGTGKELIARAIHYYSKRRNNALICINCASLPETLIESELFGYERGAFTGAVSRKPGKFEMADGGTVFLDEIGDISLSAQAKILRILQEEEFQRVGGTKTIKVDIRIIAATNKNLVEAIKKGEFREDLYYRLRVVELEIPPLRERREDILVLCEYFLRNLRSKTCSQVEGISQEAKQLLLNYRWPGNVRELRNVIERSLVFARGREILPQDLPGELRNAASPQAENTAEAPLPLDDVEKKHIIKTLHFTQGNKLKAAEILGISRSTLYEKIKQYGIGI